MIYIKSFKNYDEFKQLFSVVKHGNGVVSRKNKILLACLKNRKLFHWWLGFKEQDDRLTDNCDYLRATNMDDLKYFAKHMVSDIALHDPDSEDTLYILSFDKDFPYTLYSTTLSLDTLRGVCTDGDVKSIRYKNIERGRIFKMKAGKLISRCIEENRIPREYMPEQLKRWIGEEFARDWQVYAEQRANNNYTLHVDDDFEAIYDGERCLGDFGSCMTDKGHHTFYRDAIKAKAAYITDDDDRLSPVALSILTYGTRTTIITASPSVNTLPVKTMSSSRYLLTSSSRQARLTATSVSVPVVTTIGTLFETTVSQCTTFLSILSVISNTTTFSVIRIRSSITTITTTRPVTALLRITITNSIPRMNISSRMAIIQSGTNALSLKMIAFTTTTTRIGCIATKAKMPYIMIDASISTRAA